MIVAFMTTSGIYPSGVNAIIIIIAVNTPVRTISFVFELRIAFPPFWSEPVMVSSYKPAVLSQHKPAHAKLYNC